MSNIILNDNGLIRGLSSEFRRKFPRALAGTLNKIAISVQKDLKTHEKNDLHLTRAFLTSSTQYEPARSAQGMMAHSEVGLLDRVTFAERLVEGGDRRPQTAQYIAVPVGVGRTVRGAVKKTLKPSVILNKPGYFLREMNGTKGIWKNTPNGPQLMYKLEPITTYDEEPYLDFDKIVEDSTAQHNFELMLQQALQRAVGIT